MTSDSANEDESKHIVKRLEYFLHYWEFIIAENAINFGFRELKSHTSIINRAKLQIEGNFDHCKNNLKKYFIDDSLFNQNNKIFKSLLRSRVVSNAFNIIKTNVNATVAQFKTVSQSDYIIHIKDIENVISKKYSELILNRLIKVLSTNKKLTNIITLEIEELTNSIIIELMKKGFSKEEIAKIPENLFDIDFFPYEKSRLDFDNRDSFEEYKKTTFPTLALNEQINGLNNLLNRKSKSRYVVFKIENIIHELTPIKIFNVEFYNPKTHSKINLKNKELSFQSEDFKVTSTICCNAIVKVKGNSYQEIVNRAFTEVSKALNILNNEFDTKGYVYKHNSIVANETLDRQWDFFDANKFLIKRINADNYSQEIQDDIQYINKLDSENAYDKEIIGFISEQSRILKSNSENSLRDLWILYESFFGKDKVTEFITSCVKIYLSEIYDIQIKIFLRNTLSKKSILTTLNYTDYRFDEDELEVYSLNTIANQPIKTKKMFKKLADLQSNVEPDFLKHLIQYFIDYHSNTTLFYSNIKNWVETFSHELYLERNLGVHSRMYDFYFQIKQDKVFMLSQITTNILLKYHLKYSKSKSKEFIVDKIINIASSI